MCLWREGGGKMKRLGGQDEMINLFHLFQVPYFFLSKGIHASLLLFPMENNCFSALLGTSKSAAEREKKKPFKMTRHRYPSCSSFLFLSRQVLIFCICGCVAKMYEEAYGFTSPPHTPQMVLKASCWIGGCL